MLIYILICYILRYTTSPFCEREHDERSVPVDFHYLQIIRITYYLHFRQNSHNEAN